MQVLCSLVDLVKQTLVYIFWNRLITPVVNLCLTQQISSQQIFLYYSDFLRFSVITGPYIL